MGINEAVLSFSHFGFCPGFQHGSYWPTCRRLELRLILLPTKINKLDDMPLRDDTPWKINMADWIITHFLIGDTSSFMVGIVHCHVNFRWCMAVRDGDWIGWCCTQLPGVKVVLGPWKRQFHSKHHGIEPWVANTNQTNWQKMGSCTTWAKWSNVVYVL